MVDAEPLGWTAAALMVGTFACRRPRTMRTLAMATNVAFIGYGLAASLTPVLALHALLLPINLWRWADCSGIAGHLRRRRALHSAGAAGPIAAAGPQLACSKASITSGPR